MALVIEDGTGVAGATSYVTEAELTTYATARGVSITSGDREKWLIMAMDYLESLDFQGLKFNYDQALQWPRSYVVIDNWTINSDSIPQLLKNAQMQLATSLSQGYSQTSVVTGGDAVREKVGPIEVEYTSGGSNSAYVEDRLFNVFIYKLLNSGSNGLNFMVTC